MRVHISQIPDEIIKQYNLLQLQDDDGWIYIEVQKGMYGLPHAGMLANKLLATWLAKFGYYQTPNTNGLWKHTTRPITFILVVDDFGVAY